MNGNWLIALLSADAVLLVGIASAILHAGRLRLELRKERARAADEMAGFQTALEVLQKQVTEIRQEPAKVEQPAVRQFVPAPVLSADRRAEALGMLRSGMGTEALSATLQLSQAEAALLQKVQPFLDSAASRH